MPKWYCHTAAEQKQHNLLALCYQSYDGQRPQRDVGNVVQLQNLRIGNHALQSVYIRGHKS